MLKKIHSLFSYHLHAASFSLNLLCRKPLSTLITIVVIALTLTLPSLFWICTSNLAAITKSWQKNGHISLYLKPSLSSAEEAQVLKEIASTPGVGHATLITKEEGLKMLQAQEGMGNIMQYLSENPLPAVIEIAPSLALSNADQIEQLYTQLKANPHVEQAKLDMDWISRLQSLLSFAKRIVHAIMILLALVVILVIGNTLRLAIHNRQEEVRVLKLIGATNPFIARPFLYSGIWYSLGGALLAILFVNICLLSFAFAMNELVQAYEMHYPFVSLSVKQAYLLVLTSTVLGWIGAKLSIHTQLASIDPYN